MIPGFETSTAEDILAAIRALDEDNYNDVVTEYLWDAKKMAGGTTPNTVSQILEDKLATILEELAFDVIGNPDKFNPMDPRHTIIEWHIGNSTRSYWGEAEKTIYVPKTGKYMDYTGQTKEELDAIANEIGQNIRLDPITPTWDGALQARMQSLKAVFTTAYWNPDDLQKECSWRSNLVHRFETSLGGNAPELPKEIDSDYQAVVLYDLSRGVSDSFNKAAEIAIEELNLGQWYPQARNVARILSACFVMSTTKSDYTDKIRATFESALPTFINRLKEREKKFGDVIHLATGMQKYLAARPTDPNL